MKEYKGKMKKLILRSMPNNNRYIKVDTEY